MAWHKQKQKYFTRYQTTHLREILFLFSDSKGGGVGFYMKTSWNSARVEISFRVKLFLSSMNTSTRVEIKNISTWAEIKNTICSIFMRHDL